MESKVDFHPLLYKYIKAVLSESESVSRERKNELQKLAIYIRNKLNAGEMVNLNFICTHNSRRSHLSQIWAATAAAWYNLKGIYTYSGGTEATAFNPRAVAAIERAGFAVQNPGGENPHYMISYADNSPVMECFSKTYEDPSNPQQEFVAVMTCSEADQNCPFIPGASLRAPIRYKDPKEADNTPEEQQRYDERCRQIATEMFYLMSIVRES